MWARPRPCSSSARRSPGWRGRPPPPRPGPARCSRRTWPRPAVSNTRDVLLSGAPGLQPVVLDGGHHEHEQEEHGEADQHHLARVAVQGRVSRCNVAVWKLVLEKVPSEGS